MATAATPAAAAMAIRPRPFLLSGASSIVLPSFGVRGCKVGTAVVTPTSPLCVERVRAVTAPPPTPPTAPPGAPSPGGRGSSRTSRAKFWAAVR